MLKPRKKFVVNVAFNSNVINAMGIKPHPLLSHVRIMLDENPENLKQAVHILTGGELVAYISIICHIILLFWSLL